MRRAFLGVRDSCDAPSSFLPAIGVGIDLEVRRKRSDTAVRALAQLFRRLALRCRPDTAAAAAAADGPPAAIYTLHRKQSAAWVDGRN